VYRPTEIHSNDQTYNGNTLDNSQNSGKQFWKYSSSWNPNLKKIP
jgi:hypothetical protein